MIGRLKSFAIQKAYALAVKRGCHCPNCGAQLDMPAQLSEEEGFDTMFSCWGCDWRGVLSDLMKSENRRTAEVSVKPERSKIREEETMSGKRWKFPASHRPNFLLFFAFLWLGIVGFISWEIFQSSLIDSSGEDVSPTFAFLFLIPFWLIGLGVLYFGLRNCFGHSLLEKKDNELIFRSFFFGSVKERSIDLEDIKSVSLEEAYRQNERPVYNVTVFAKQGKDIKFGTTLSQDEKRWMIGELTEGEEIKNEQEDSSSYVSRSTGPKIEDRELDELSTKHLTLESMSGSGFRILVKSQMGTFIIVGSIIFLIAGGMMFGFGIKDFSVGEGTMGLIFALMASMPVLFGAAGLVIGLVAFFTGLHFSGRTYVHEFGEDALVSVLKKRGQVLKKNRISRSSFEGIRISESGRVNDSLRFKVVILGQKHITICGFVDRDIATEIEQWVLHWMQNDKKLAGYGGGMTI